MLQVDSSSDTVEEAQRLANMIVDHARYNHQKFTKAADEKSLLLTFKADKVQKKYRNLGTGRAFV